MASEVYRNVMSAATGFHGQLSKEYNLGVPAVVGGEVWEI